MPFLICYDIENDRLRDKTSKRLEYCGFLRMQKSVFAGDLEKSQLTLLEAWLAKTILPALQPDDRIAILRIGADQLAAVKHLNKVPEGWDDLIDPPVALIL